MKKLLFLSISLLINSCSYLNIPNSNEGIAYFKINFNNKSSFNIKAIPETTNSIKITITGEGLEEPRILELTKNESNVTVTKLPEGKKNIEVLALNSKNMIVAEAKAEVIIEKSKVKTVEIELKPTDISNIDPNLLLEKLDLTLKNIPENINVLLQIKKDNIEINKEFKGNKILLNSIPKGKVLLKVFASETDSKYSFSSEVDLQKDTLEINVEKFSLQNELDKIIENNNINANTNLQDKISTLLNKIIISVKNNNKPFLENIDITVNGDKKTFGLSRPICLNQNDKLKISVTASDKDNDKLMYSWGITQMKNDDINNPQYDTKIEREGSNILERDVSFRKGNLFIGFSITDKKSFIHTTIPFLVSDIKCN